VKMDNNGYYISFPHGKRGINKAISCYLDCNGKKFDGYKMQIEPWTRAMEDVAPWCRRTDDLLSQVPFGTLFRAVGEDHARLFDYDSMEHFMRCMGWNFLDRSHYSDAEALLTSWRTEAAYVLDPRTNIRR